LVLFAPLVFHVSTLMSTHFCTPFSPTASPRTGGHSGGTVGAALSWVVSGVLGLLGHRVVDPRNPLAVRSGLHVELLGVMNYREYMCMCLCVCPWGDARVAGQHRMHHISCSAPLSCTVGAVFFPAEPPPPSQLTVRVGSERDHAADSQIVVHFLRSR
jgi:hypothetical protein